MFEDYISFIIVRVVVHYISFILHSALEFRVHFIRYFGMLYLYNCKIQHSKTPMHYIFISQLACWI